MNNIETFFKKFCFINIFFYCWKIFCQIFLTRLAAPEAARGAERLRHRRSQGGPVACPSVCRRTTRRRPCPLRRVTHPHQQPFRPSAATREPIYVSNIENLTYLFLIFFNNDPLLRLSVRPFIASKTSSVKKLPVDNPSGDDFFANFGI